jgi:hypothetical protein
MDAGAEEVVDADVDGGGGRMSRMSSNDNM